MKLLFEKGTRSRKRQSERGGGGGEEGEREGQTDGWGAELRGMLLRASKLS